MGSEENGNETVELLIRCAMQSFEDTPVTCPIDCTVLQLKEKLAVACSSKPEVSRQRLIYAGHCLQDNRSLRSVFESRPVGDDVRVIHLVCPPRDLAEFDGIRRRNPKKNDESTRPTVSNPQPTHTTNPGPSVSGANTGVWPQYSPNYASFHNNQYGNQSAQLQSAYNAYVMSYTNYMQQMMLAMSGNAAFAGVQPFIPPQFPMDTAATPVAQPQPAADVAADIAPAAEGLVQDAVAGDVEAPPRDFLDIVYKAIRMCFLVMLVYVYSSAERFLGVLFFIMVVWFVQARRDRNNRQRANREVAQAVNNVRQQHQVDETDGETTQSDDVNAASESNEYREPTAWAIFWSTCYTFITSFFTSLIPDNPVPANVN